ncbi:MAG: Eco57I restriction-modification methylase domain-containing protein [Nitrosopumilaceae archaeon]|nr:Eco57I restriction-modification methylase domain-containing protein [Nitrosopumilaceae archaeon]
MMEAEGITAMQSASSALDYADTKRRSMILPKKQRLEQYFSSAPLARLMASMMDYPQEDISILDPGAGVGSLFAACIEEVCGLERPPRSVSLFAYEVDPALWDSLGDSLGRVGEMCERRDIRFSGNLLKRDFVSDYSRGVAPHGFTHAIMNPPYGKISVSSKPYEDLRRVGLQTTNTYAAFVAISQNMLGDGGQMVFISPRSFCNGTYFDPFRKRLLESMALRRIHLFGSRTSPFRDDSVLQENVIIHAEKRGHPGMVVVSSSAGPRDRVEGRRVDSSKVVFDDDPRRFIHIVPDAAGARISSRVRGLECTLDNLGLGVSTGRVVDFRIRDELRPGATDGAVPLVRPFNISGGTMAFPIEGRKHHNFIMESEKSKKLLVENGSYVLVKRFTTVEEKRRVVAAVWTGKEYGTKLVGFENRTNYLHRDGGGLDLLTARGLWAFLNSTVVDSYFRQFNGSTQVNATDLRYLRYPSEGRLRRLGAAVPDGRPEQEILDNTVEGLLFGS